mmetsp:Transcript_104288/g.238792  ORF Transcript_104288/g.238792 Transcript_104288/m.238792 type:complete len:207 (+) Transcript_104288:101-721(+)
MTTHYPINAPISILQLPQFLLSVTQQLQEVQENLNDVHVDGQRSQNIVVQRERTGTLMLASDYQLGVVHQEEREKDGSTTSVDLVHDRHMRNEHHDEAEEHEADDPREQIGPHPSEIRLGGQGVHGQGAADSASEAAGQGHRLDVVLGGNQANEQALAQRKHQQDEVVLGELSELLGSAHDDAINGQEHGKGESHEPRHLLLHLPS